MKTIIMTILAALTLVAADPVPPTTGTGVNSTNTSNSAINQNFITSSSSGRQVVNTGGSVPMVQLQSYLGPWTNGPSHILDNLAAIPEELTLEQAKKLYAGGVDIRINRMADKSVQYKSIKFLPQFPSKVVKIDGKDYMIPDESKFQRMAFIHAVGSGDATTVDVVAKGVQEAIKAGANAILVLKKSTINETKTTGMSLGIGGVTGSLHGDDATKSTAGSFGTSIGYAKAKPVYRETMLFLAICVNDLPTK